MASAQLTRKPARSYKQGQFFVAASIAQRTRKMGKEDTGAQQNPPTVERTIGGLVAEVQSK
jgi:hypothetical protein